MDNKKIDPISLMNHEIEKQKEYAMKVIMEELNDENILSKDAIMECLDTMSELRGYMYCCADLGYYESREKVDEFIDQLETDLGRYLMMSATNNYEC